MRDTSLVLKEMKLFKGKVDRLILGKLLPKKSDIPEVGLLYRMMRDYPERPAKGMRPFICATSCRAFGGREEDALLTAACLELFQNWILIHDDIEDGSEMRRGSPALHKVYDWRLALNAGDALHARMWSSLLLNSRLLGERRSLEVMEEFGRMINETTEGQHIELGWVVGGVWSMTELDYFEMCSKKTSWYTTISPMRLGAIAAGADRRSMEVLVGAGRKLGIGFQIHDDVLNLSAGAKYGKEIADDLLEGKRTLILIRLLSLCSPSERKGVIRTFSLSRDERRERVPGIMELVEKHGALQYAQKRAVELVEGALSTLKKVNWKGDRESVETLEAIARFAVERDW